jgi:superfamily II DNA or RNA helicase
VDPQNRLKLVPLTDPAPETRKLPLLEALLALKPNVIYTMATPKEIARASSAFSQGAVRSFRWGKSGRILEAKMGSGARILFTVADGRLQTSAQPESAHTKANILPAIMTVARVLLGTKFHTTDLRENLLEQFRAELRAPAPDAVRPRVIMEAGAPGGRFALDYDSGDRAPSWRVTDPPPGMEWLRWQEREPERVADGFMRWLAAKPNGTDIEIRTPDGSQIVPDPRPAKLRGRTLLDTDSNRIIIRRAVLDESDSPLDPFMDIGYGLVFLPGQKIFSRPEPASAWGEFAKLGPISPDDQCLSLPADTFFIPCPDPGAWALTGDGGREVKPDRAKCRTELQATSAGSRVRVRLRLVSDNGQEIPAHRTFARALESLFLDGPFALLVQGAGRRRRIAELLAEGPTTESGQTDPADDPAFTSRAMHGEDAAKCLRHLRRELRLLDRKHLFADPARPGNPWLACCGAGTALLRGFAAFVRAFPGEDPLRAKNLAFEVDAAKFFATLPALAIACSRSDVFLRVHKKSARTETITLSVRIARTDMIDWFEIHPEARAGALTIPRDQWDEVLRGGYFSADDNDLVAFDAESLSRLGQLAAMSGDTRIPRLRIFDWIALRKSGVECELPPEDAAVLRSLLELEAVPRRALPPSLRANLREYQQRGYEWLCFLYTHRFGACLADDMGLGKTLQAIALLAAIQDGSLARQAPGQHAPHLIVLPSTLVFNWQSEIEKFAPSLKIHEYTGQGRSAEFGDADIVLTTYGLVHRDIETLANVHFDIAIFDEAQAVKNAAAARSRAVARLNARFRLCLTGTPLENHLGEFHSIMETAVPGIFGERGAFLREQESGLPVLERVRPFLLRRTKEKILSELPPKVEADSYFSLTELQRECYTRAVGEVRAEVLAAFEDRPSQQAGIIALAALMRLRQICIAPAMLSDAFASDSPKIEFLVAQLAELAEEGHAALVFSQFLRALDMVGSALDTAGLPFLRMDGSTPMRERKSLVSRFQSGDSPGIFLVSMKTGGSGLNLTRASYVYHLDPWWNPAVENQASDRAHRIGQSRSVLIRRLLMRHTVEEKMMELKARKQALFDAVLDRAEGSSPGGAAALTAADFQFLIAP